MTSSANSRIDINFVNNGSITVQQGDLDFFGPMSMASTGTISAATGTNVFFEKATTFADGAKLTGAGHFILFNNTTTLTVNGTLFNSATATGSYSLDPGAFAQGPVSGSVTLPVTGEGLAGEGS